MNVNVCFLAILLLTLNQKYMKKKLFLVPRGLNHCILVHIRFRFPN